jgi:hypothetical protein
MGMLAFFPLYTAPDPVRLGRFQLVPYERGRGAHQQAALIDAVLSAYVEPGAQPAGQPVDSVTLVHLADREPTTELTEEERASLFQLAEIVAFTALSRREFFSVGRYVNRDDFKLIIQRFSESSPTGVSIMARQRDGVKLTGYGAGAFRSTRPPQANSPSNFNIDVTFASALLAVAETPLWPRYEDAVYSFNSANTDRDDTPEQHEVVATVGAFQQVLEAEGRADAIASKLDDLLRPYLAADPSPSKVDAARRFEARRRGSQREYTPPRSMTEAWFRDFFFVRNAFGHGQRREDRSRWTSSEHLLFAAYIFPFVVAASLAADGHYALTDAERKRAWGFPYYLTLRHPLARRRYLRARSRFAWLMARETIASAERRDAIRRAYEVLERGGTAGAGGTGGTGGTGTPPAA